MGTAPVVRNAEGAEDAFGEAGEERDRWKKAFEERQKRVKDDAASA